MKLIRTLSKDEVTIKDGKKVRFNNYFLEVADGVLVAIKPCFDDDKRILKAFAEFRDNQ